MAFAGDPWENPGPAMSCSDPVMLASRPHPYAEFLGKVAKPGRYIGGEEQQRVKTDAGLVCRFVLAFPDLYEVGMSHLGTRILYNLINNADDLACAQQLASTDCYAGTQNLADNIACAAVIGGPTGVCGVNQCATTADCSGTATCEDHVCVPRTCGIDGDCSLAERCLATACVPASCPVPCMPGEACEHGVCQ